MSVNKLILGDNLEILKEMASATVDLIYLDPPFFSNRNYEVIWGDEGEIRSFQDRWAGGMEHYIAWLKERVVEMHRVLKPTGSLFLHCDWHANAYIRVEILDRIFGAGNFRNEIIWDYEGWVHKKMSHFPNKHDTIFLYSKSDRNTFIPLSEAWTKEEYVAMRKQKIHIDKNDREYIFDKRGNAGQRRYLEVALADGQPITDVWSIGVLTSSSKERIGYPTQKPEALLERIIKCASHEGDLILDPFMGGGTTLAVADRLNRKWIGVDQSVQAVKVTELRLQQQTDLFTNIYVNSYTLQLHKYDYDTLRHQNAFEFESWIIAQFGGTPHNKKGGDKGVDGKMPDGTPIQVKRSDMIVRDVVDKFLTAVERYDATLFAKNVAAGKPVGHVIAFSFSRGAVEEVARLKNRKNILIELVPVDQIVPLAKKPTVSVEVSELSRDARGVHEIEFIAAGQSAAGVEFYSWDFEYDEEKGFRASVIRDREGKQACKLKAGVHYIAVKVVDNDGLEGVEVVKLKVNGVVEPL